MTEYDGRDPNYQVPTMNTRREQIASRLRIYEAELRDIANMTVSSIEQMVREEFARNQLIKDLALDPKPSEEDLLTEEERAIWSKELLSFFKDDVADPQFELDTYGLAVAKAQWLKDQRRYGGKKMTDPELSEGKLLQEIDTLIARCAQLYDNAQHKTLLIRVHREAIFALLQNAGYQLVPPDNTGALKEEAQ